MPGLCEVTIYSDGGCSPNPGIGAYAAVLMMTVDGSPVERVVTGAVEHANNQIMELTAVAVALESLKRPCAVTLFADSQYVVKGMTEWIETWLENGWRNSKNQPVKHVELWQRIYAQCQRHTVTFQWVKAHGDNSLNAKVDGLVQQVRAQFIAEQSGPAPEPTPAAEPTTKPYRLMIAGSRKANANMLEYARRVVARAVEMGWEIVVGDNPEGIDAKVVRECNQRGLSTVVVGIADQPRNGGVSGGRYVQIGTSYAERDQLMVKASDRTLFIWDGQSPGTQSGYQYARQLGKQADLINFASTFV